jgi:transposase
MLSIHPQARTTPAVRQEIARSPEPTGVLANCFGASLETIRKWRKRSAEDCQDQSSRPHKLPWKATEEERAIVCALRRSTGFPLDDLTFMVTHFLPHLNRDAVYRILKAEGLGRLPPAHHRKRRSDTFKDYDLSCEAALKVAPSRGKRNTLVWRHKIKFDGLIVGAADEPADTMNSPAKSCI